VVPQGWGLARNKHDRAFPSEASLADIQPMYLIIITIIIIVVIIFIIMMMMIIIIINIVKA